MKHSLKKILREKQESPVGYGELLELMNEVLEAVRAGEKPETAVGDTSRFSPELRQVVELINESLSCLNEQCDYQIKKLDLVVQASDIGLWDMQIVQGDPVNPNNSFTWSDKFRHMLGYSNETDFPNVLSSWSNKLHPDDKKRTLDCFAAHLTDRSGRTPYDLEYRVLKKNGEYAYIHAFGATSRDEQGYALRVAGAIRDISEEKKTALEKETTDVRLSMLTKSMNIALWDMAVDPSDPTGASNAFWWSQEFRHMLGFSGEHDFPNILSSWSDRLHPEDKEKTLNAFAKHMMDKTGKTPYNVEYRIKRKTGEYVWFRADGATLRDERGTPIRVIGSVEDISDKLHQAELTSHITEFSRAIEDMTRQIDSLVTATAGIAEAQESNLSIAIESEKNAAETTSIIAAIKNLASQSNVLGINASIEAARAGQAGKGFAVVSEEVRKLALNSKNSADQIEAKLKTLQTSTKQIFEAIHGSDELIGKQNTIIAKLKEDLVSVNAMYDELVTMVAKSR